MVFTFDIDPAAIIVFFKAAATCVVVLGVLALYRMHAKRSR